MCLFVKTNVKLVAVLTFLLIVVLCNWFFWVYRPPADQHLCGGNMTQEVSLEYCNSTRIWNNASSPGANGLWVNDKVCCKNICGQAFPTHNIIERTFLNSSLKVQSNIPVVQCVFENVTNTSSKVFRVLLKLKHQNNITHYIHKCTEILARVCRLDHSLKLINNSQTLSDVSNNSLFCLEEHKSSVPCNVTDGLVVELRMVYSYLMLVFAILLHVVTLAAYLVVPRLRARYGNSIMSYVAAQMIRKVALVVMMGAVPDIHAFQGVSIYGAAHFSFDITAHLWQIIVTYQIWNAFRFKRFESSQKMTNIQFIILSSVVWGCPAVLMAVYKMMYDMYMRDPSTWVLRSTFEIAVLVVLEVVSMGLSTATLIQLRESHRGSGSLRGADSRRHNSAEVHWGSLYMKIVLLAGADYVFVMSLFFADTVLELTSKSFAVSDITYYVMWDIYNMKGVEMLFLFVLKRDVWNCLCARFGLTELPLKETTTTDSRVVKV